MTALNALLALVESVEVDSDLQHFTCEFDSSANGLEAAKQLLAEYNGHNRKTIPSRIKLFVSDFLGNVWGKTYEQISIGIKKDGSYFIISGQHRLIAFVKACELLEADPSAYEASRLVLAVTITVGASASEADKFDLVKTRTDGDIIYRDESFDKVRGRWNDNPTKKKKWSNALAVAARLVRLRELGLTVSSAKALSSAEILDYVKKYHSGLPAYVTNVLDLNDEDEGNGGLKMSFGYIAALWYVASLEVDGKINDECSDAIFDFLTNLANGTNLTKGSPAHALTGYWNKLTSEKGSKDRDRDWVAPFIRSVRALLNGDEITPRALKLTTKQRDQYVDCPETLDGWDQACQEAAIDAKIDKENSDNE